MAEARPWRRMTVRGGPPPRRWGQASTARAKVRRRISAQATWRLERLHLQFGYHVEHHIFPTVNGRHAATVRAVLRRLYGERYLSLPHTTALRLLYTRPKIHFDHDTLIDPRTRQIFNALAPGDLSMAAVGPMDGC